jgi:hypothetical protein
MGKLVQPQGYVGDMEEDQAFVFWFSSCDKDGASITITTIGTIREYRDVTVQTPSGGVTITQNADGKTGCHRVVVDLSAASWYVPGRDYRIALTGMTVDGETVNVALCEFSIENRLK